MRTINYNFTGLVDACGDVIVSSGSSSSLFELKKEINRFFKDSKCVDIIYTNNDSLFFGMSVYPITDKELINAIIQDDAPVRFKKYSIEIDSKILSPIIDLTPTELCAMLLHEIGHIVNDPNPVNEVRDAINVSLCKRGESINVPKTVQYYQILAYGIKNTVRKMNSMFFIYADGEILADEFVHMCGFGDDLNNAFNKICRSGMKVNDNVNKLVALTWTLDLYKNVKIRRIPALRLIRKMKSLCGSQIEKREIEMLERALNTIDDDFIVQESANIDNLENYYITEGDNSRRRTSYAQLKKEATLKNMRKFEGDVYEYSMRIRHVSEEEDAMYLMRQINTRISVMEDFLDNVRLSDVERDRWFALLDKYYSLREQLANNTTYRYDYSGGVIQVNYPRIVEDRM